MLNVLVWTTFFICGFLPFVTVRALDVPLVSMALGWAAFWLMTAGLLLAAVPLLGNAAWLPRSESAGMGATRRPAAVLVEPGP